MPGSGLILGKNVILQQRMVMVLIWSSPVLFSIILYEKLTINPDQTGFQQHELRQYRVNSKSIYWLLSSNSDPGDKSEGNWNCDYFNLDNIGHDNRTLSRTEH